MSCLQDGLAGAAGRVAEAEEGKDAEAASGKASSRIPSAAIKRRQHVNHRAKCKWWCECCNACYSGFVGNAGLC